MVEKKPFALIEHKMKPKKQNRIFLLRKVPLIIALINAKKITKQDEEAQHQPLLQRNLVDDPLKT